MRLAIIGATGKIGRTFIELLQEVDTSMLPKSIRLVASERSSGQKIQVLDESVVVEALEAFDFSEVDCAFFALSHELTEKYIPIAREKCRLVIDNSSAYRLHKDVPLIVPEINFSDWEKMGRPNLISNPNCSTIQMVVALHPIFKSFGIRRIDVATYQSISGAGSRALKDFEASLAGEKGGDGAESVLNVVPMIDRMLDTGMTKEEMKMHWESRKIWSSQSLTVQATCVRVPVMVGHAEAIHVEAEQVIDWEVLSDSLDKQSGLVWHKEGMVTPYVTGRGNNSVHMARLRRDISDSHRVSMWVVADNMRKGGAWNALQIYTNWVGSMQPLQVD